MIDVLVPPVILVLIVALLITFLARAMKNTPGVKEDLENMRKASRKSKRVEEISASIKGKFSDVSKVIEKAAGRKYRKTKDLQNREIERRDMVSNSILGTEVLPDNKLKIDDEIVFSVDKVAEEDNYYEIEEERERYLVKQIESNPKNLTSYQQLGDYYMETHKFEEAKESYKYVLRIDPRNKKAQESMKKLDHVLR